MSSFTVGVDEVGRGSLVGSAVVCAFRSEDSLFGTLPFSVNDSKKINKNQRELIYQYFKKNKNFNYSYKIILGKQKDIERFNIHNVVLNSMSKAVIALHQKNDQIVIDGKFIPENLKKYNSSAIIKADNKIEQVSAASIIAKVFRDKLLEKLHKIESTYGWDKNAGYGTNEHILAINQNGISKFHRKTYQPICQLIKKLST